jgi:hypothetical protein
VTVRPTDPSWPAAPVTNIDPSSTMHLISSRPNEYYVLFVHSALTEHLLCAACLVWRLLRVAEDTIHCVQQALGVPRTESPTRYHVLHGAEGFTDDYWQKLCTEYQIPEETARHLTAKFGTASDKVVALSRVDSALAHPILAGRPAIQGEVVYSVRHEMAATIEDVLARRLGIQLYSWRDAIEAAPVVGRVMAQELGWTSEFTRAATADYVGKVNRLLDAAGLSDKESASPARGQSAME